VKKGGVWVEGNARVSSPWTKREKGTKLNKKYSVATRKDDPGRAISLRSMTTMKKRGGGNRSGKEAGTGHASLHQRGKGEK